MTYDEICRSVRKLKLKYDEADPFRLCECLGVLLIPRSLGTEEGAIKGFFLEFKHVQSITVNSDLPEIIQKIIVAHELGHAVLHRKSGMHSFQDVTLYDSASTYEKEANIFAAELLLADDAVLSTLNGDSTFFTAASALMVPIELLDFKFRILKWKGYTLAEAPVSARSNFLRDLPLPPATDDCIC